MQEKTNNAILAGTIVSLPKRYAVKGETLVEFFLEIKRTSGNSDRVCVNAPERLIGNTDIGAKCCFEGEIRSYDRETDKRRLHIRFLAQRLHDYNGDINHVELTGIICKDPQERTTPRGRRICDLILANNRAYGHASYLPTIVWDSNAMMAARMSVGTTVAVEGRFQSRDYQKETANGVETLTAYEISACRISIVQEP